MAEVKLTTTSPQLLRGRSTAVNVRFADQRPRPSHRASVWSPTHFHHNLVSNKIPGRGRCCKRIDWITLQGIHLCAV